MRPVVRFDVSDVIRFNPDRRAPLWWGIIGLITIEATVVASFITSYLYIAFHAPVWPPEGMAPPPVFWPSINVALLLISCGTMYWAGRAIRQGNQRHLAVGVTVSVVLASIVLVTRSLEFAAFEFDWKGHAYGSLTWTVAGFHYVHVVSIVVGSAAVAVLAWRGYFTAQRQIGVVVDTMYWYFVCLAWVPLYFTLYWVPRLHAG